MSTGTAMPKMANLPRFLRENRKVFSTTSRAYPFASTNLLGFTSVGMRGPAIDPAAAHKQTAGPAGEERSDFRRVSSRNDAMLLTECACFESVDCSFPNCKAYESFTIFTIHRFPREIVTEKASSEDVVVVLMRRRRL